MTKDVVVTVLGSQDEEHPIELMVSGSYFYKDDKHYVFYEEQPDESGSVVKNRICFDDKVFEMSKKGAVNSRMTFDSDMMTLTEYQTPYGPINLEIITDHYELRDHEDLMEMDIYYTLSFGDKDSRECHVAVKVESVEHRDKLDTLKRRRVR